MTRKTRIDTITLDHPYALAPMAGMTDTAFRRLVKARGGCGLVVTEMVSSDRTLEYAEYTEEERPVSIQIFGGDPGKMAAAAQVVEGMGADIVDVNMGCPVPKIAKHNAGCSLMREPPHAASVVRAMTDAVSIPVTVKMRASSSAAARSAIRGSFSRRRRLPREVIRPRWRSRTAAASCWTTSTCFCVRGRTRQPASAMSRRGRGLRGGAPRARAKLRALGSWYTKGEHGGALLRTAVNRAGSIDELRGIIRGHYLESDDAPVDAAVALSA